VAGPPTTPVVRNGTDVCLESWPMSTAHEIHSDEAPAAPAGPPGAPRSRVVTRLLHQPLRNLGIGVTAIVLGSTAAFGGLEPATEKPQLSPVEVGVRTHVAPYDITINKVLWVSDLPNVYPMQDGDHWLAVTATVRNTHDTSLSGGVELAQALTLSRVEGLVHRPEPGTDRVRSDYQKLIADSSDLDPVQPGIDYPMVFLFEQKAASTPPDRIRVQFVAHTWREDSIDKTFQWFDPTVIAESELPVRVSRPTSTPTAAP
jgi:hypothetical protein